MFFRGRQQAAIFVEIVVMAAGFVLFRYMPLRKKMRVIKQTKTEQALAVARTSVESKQLPILKAQLQQLQKAAESYETNIPAERALGVFLHQIATLMNEYNLKEQLVQPRREIETDEFNCIPVNIQCKGKLNQIYEFYKRVQELNRLIRIEQVNLANDRGLGGEVTMKTRVVIYYRPQSEQG